MIRHSNHYIQPTLHDHQWEEYIFTNANDQHLHTDPHIYEYILARSSWPLHQTLYFIRPIIGNFTCACQFQQKIFEHSLTNVSFILTINHYNPQARQFWWECLKLTKIMFHFSSSKFNQPDLNYQNHDDDHHHLLKAEWILNGCV